MFVLLIVNGNISFGIGIVSLFEFRWAVDQDGYEIERIAAREGSSLVDTVYEHEVIRPRGGPLRGYRPMDDYPDLWRRFTACVDASSALAFVQKFGPISSFERVSPAEWVDNYVRNAELIRQIAAHIDANDYVAAAALWNERARPSLTAGLIPMQHPGKFEFRPIPVTLLGALLLQIGEAIAHSQQWRHCRNDGCPEWFRVGEGAHTSRREFCSDRCRVASARRHKATQEL
jgi:hypothetical protein